MSAKVMYLIDEDRVNRDLIERLIKNEFGSLIVKHFDSCEVGYAYLLKEQGFTHREYPDTILLSQNLSAYCISRFLEELEKFQSEWGKSIQVFMIEDVLSSPSSDFTYSTLVKGSIKKPICPNALLKIAESVFLQTNK